MKNETPFDDALIDLLDELLGTKTPDWQRRIIKLIAEVGPEEAARRYEANRGREGRLVRRMLAKFAAPDAGVDDE